MNLKKFTSGVLGIVMITGSVLAFGGCNKKTAGGNGAVASTRGINPGKVETVEDDGEWYNVEKIVIDPGYDNIDYINYSEPVISNGYVYVPINGSKEIDSQGFTDEDWENLDYSEYSIDEILKLDMSGNVVKQITMKDIAEEVFIESTFFSDDKLYIRISCWEGDIYEQKIAVFDTLTDSISEVMETPFDFDSNSGTIENVIPLKDGGFLYSIYSYDTSSYVLHIVENGEETAAIDLARIGYEDVWDAGGFYYASTGDLTIFFSDEQKCFPVSLNMDTYAITEMEYSGKEMTYEDIWFLSRCSDGSAYCTEADGIKRLNPDTLSLETVFDFEHCNIRRNDLNWNMNVLSLSEDSVVMAGMAFPNSVGSSADYLQLQLVFFTKADANPNAGKTIIDVGVFGNTPSLPYSIDEAVYQFNETNPDYFARLSYLSYEDFYDGTSRVEEPESWTAYDNKATLELTNQLTVDLLSGDAPDIILDAAGCQQLNNDDYLLDLNEFVNGENGLDTSLYYNNVFEAANYNGKLYQIPLAFSVNGISTSPENAPANGIGYTYEEYAELVRTVGNGKDPKAAFTDRLEYFASGLQEMGDLFIDSETSTVNFQNADFYSFANYCLNTIPENAIYDDYLGSMDIYSNFTEFNETNLTTLRDYATMIYGEEERGIFGLSSDGRGPSINVVQSAAISANCSDIDGAWDFVLCLLSEDIQYQAGNDFLNPVNKAAARTVSAEFMNSINQTYEENIEYYPDLSPIELRSMGIYECSEETMERYLELLETADHVQGIDSAILDIAVEEIPAFFTGQKSIEDVAATINNRAQTVIDER